MKPLVFACSKEASDFNLSCILTCWPGQRSLVLRQLQWQSCSKRIMKRLALVLLCCMSLYCMFVYCIPYAGQAWNHGPDPKGQPESNFQRSEGESSALVSLDNNYALFQVHKFMIAPKDFSLPGGELTPTMKLKRHTVMEMYEKKIQQVSSITLFNLIQFFSPCADVRARDPELHVVTIFSHPIPFPSRESSSHQHRSPFLLSYQQQS